MKEILKKFYDLDVFEFKEYNDGYIFFLNDEYYHLVKCSYDEAYLINLFKYCSYNKIRSHDFVFNKDGKILSQGYVLLHINSFIDVIDYDDIKYFNLINCNDYESNYVSVDNLWESKIDYLEIQLSELSNNKIINNSFDYFVGISENLILFYRKNIKDKKYNLCLSHCNLVDINTISFYNPLNYCVDYWLKDIATYVRISKDYVFLEKILNQLTDYSDRIYLFVRLLFPVKYFNEVSNVILDNKDNFYLIDIVNHVKDYEKYIGIIQNIFSMNLFSWIKKE